MVSGTKNTNTWRIATIAKSAMASPAHVARDTFVLTGDWLDVRPNGAPTLSVSIYCPNKMLGGAVWIQENTRRFHATIVFACCQLARPESPRPFSRERGG